MDQKTVPDKVKSALAPTRPVPATPAAKAARPGTTPPDLQAPPHQPEAKSYFSSLKPLVYFGLGLLLALTAFLAVAAAGGLLYVYRSDYLLPGVTIGAIDVGWRTTAEATALLEQQWQTKGILLTNQNLNQGVTPETLGLSLDIPTAVQAAYQQGRSWESLRQMIESDGRAHFTPTLRFDEGLARTSLEAMAPLYDLAPVSADIRLVAGQVEAVPAVAGQALDVPATLAPLRHSPSQVLTGGQLPLVLKAIPAEVSDVSRVVSAANRLLAHSVQILAYDPINDETVAWEVEGKAWAQWVSIWLDAREPDGFAWELDRDRAQTALTERFDRAQDRRYLRMDEAGPAIIEAITRQTGTVKLRLHHREQAHTVQPGETLSSIGFDYGLPYPWIEAANPSLGNSLVPGQVITIPSPDELLPLPVVENKRIVVSLSEQKTWVYENGAVKWAWPASTGIKSSPTAPGIFQVQSHRLNAYAASWDLWMPDFMGIYRPVPSVDFMNGFHGFPTRSGSNLLWTDDLGHPVTYGCILLDSQNAATLFEWAEAGVVVEIRR